MKPAHARRGKLRHELVSGFIAVTFLGGLVTYGVVLLSSRHDFDALVEKNDIEVASSISTALAAHYETVGSWEGVEMAIGAFRYDPTFRPARGDSGSGGKRHPKDSDIPLVVTDAHGAPVYVGLRAREGERAIELPKRFKTTEGVKIIANGVVVGYAFFKSMVFRSYNPQEVAFLVSSAKSIGWSVLIGLVLALTLGTMLASRFARPIAALDAAVKTIAEGDLSARVGVSRNDEIGSLAANFNSMADKLQTAESARQNLLADIAHELRTPVSIIQANLEMIIDGLYAADEKRLKSLYEETRILTDLIADLRSLSDLEVGNLSLSREEVSLPALLEKSCRKLRPLFEERGIEFDLALDDGEILVLAEEDKLRQVFSNVLGNALKYAPMNSVVSIVLARVNGGTGGSQAVRVSIADEGPGVPPGDTDKIFDRFYRVDSSRNRESGGRGLGLAISKRIIEAFNGRIGALNREPQGLAVWIELPIMPSA